MEASSSGGYEPTSASATSGSATKGRIPGRMNRNAPESLRLGELVEATQVRLVGASDGFDSSNQQSKIMLAMMSSFNEVFIDQLKAKVHRGAKKLEQEIASWQRQVSRLTEQRSKGSRRWRPRHHLRQGGGAEPAAGGQTSGAMNPGLRNACPGAPMVAVLTASPTRSKVRPHVGTASSRRSERRGPEKTPLYKAVAEHLEGYPHEPSRTCSISGSTNARRSRIHPSQSARSRPSPARIVS